MTNIFLYGTLRYLPLLSVVLGRDPGQVLPATLREHRVFRVNERVFPGIVAAKGATAEGIVVTGLTAEELERLDYYEFAPIFDYGRKSVTVDTLAGPLTADVFMPAARLSECGPWSLEDWIEQSGEHTALAAVELMSFFRDPDKPLSNLNYTQMQVRAASAVRASKSAKPTRIRSDRRSDSVELISSRQPYTNFFALTEKRLRFPRFDGSMSAEIEREGFLGGDAVTVLPYDPVRDRVLVIEQFRFAPYMRGDVRPWVLEPVAGRIDPGEVPEETARRELREEARLEVGALHFIGSYYPSPSCFSEYIYSYIGICDLPDDAAGIAGVSSEAEDIRSHILPFQRAQDMIFDGEADAAPLFISLMWLARERDRLRKGA